MNARLLVGLLFLLIVSLVWPAQAAQFPRNRLRVIPWAAQPVSGGFCR